MRPKSKQTSQISANLMQETAAAAACPIAVGRGTGIAVFICRARARCTGAGRSSGIRGPVAASQAPPSAPSASAPCPAPFLLLLRLRLELVAADGARVVFLQPGREAVEVEHVGASAGLQDMEDGGRRDGAREDEQAV